MDWDHYRYFLELARTGRLATAARRLEVDQATVSRRVQGLEKALCVSLFARTSAGMTLTEAGRELLVDVEAMEAAAARLASSGGRCGNPVAGVVRVGSTEGFGATILAPHLAALVALNPGLVIDLVAVSAVVNISRREADIVVSMERPRRGPFIAVKLSDYLSYVYASAAYLDAAGPIADVDAIRRHRWIGYVDDLIFSRQVQFIDDLEPPGRFVVRSTSIHAQIEAAAAGAGLVALPAFLADRDPRLSCVLREQLSFRRQIWMTMPAELKDVPRIRATWEAVRAAVAAERAVILPEGG